MAVLAVKLLNLETRCKSKQNAPETVNKYPTLPQFAALLLITVLLQRTGWRAEPLLFPPSHEGKALFGRGSAEIQWVL